MVVCPADECGCEFEQVAIHWDSNPSHRPSLTDRQHEILTGLVMGDGSVFRKSANPKIEVLMTKPMYLRYLHDLFDILSTGYSLQLGGDEKAKKNYDDGYDDELRLGAYSDMYVWRTRTHPEIEEYASWYRSGKKVWPYNLEMTPRTFKHWYCCDGNLNKKSESYSIRISMNNEAGNEEKIRNYFDDSVLPEPDSWFEYDVGRDSMNCEARWYYQKSQQIFSEIGAPLPGFNNKWPDEITYSWGDL